MHSYIVDIITYNIGPGTKVIKKFVRNLRIFVVN